MLTLNDGRSELWQWDTGRTLAVDADCSQVHFSNKVFGRSIDVDVVNGAAIIPDVLLQTDKDLNVWAFVGTAENGYTKISKTFKVNRRNKPSDYVFTPTEQTTLAELVEQIGNLGELTTEAKDNLVAAINEAAKSGGGGGSVSMRVDNGYIQYSTDGGASWNNLIATAELQGPQGQKGDTGPQGPQGEKGPAGVVDTSLGVTGATVGQIAKITAVDDTGKPTAWEAVDMASREDWRRIRGETFDGSNTNLFEISADEYGNAICLKKVFFAFAAPNISYNAMNVIAKYTSGENWLFHSLSYTDHKNADYPVVGFIDATTPYFTGYIAKTSGYFNQNTYGFLGGARNPKVVSENITSISIGVSVGGTNNFGADCTYEIWGVDA